MTFQKFLIVFAGSYFLLSSFLLQIRVEFDPVLLLPAESYLRQWISINNEHFPKNGWASQVYSGELEYKLEEFEKLDQMIASLERATQEEWYLVCKFPVPIHNRAQYPTDMRPLLGRGHFVGLHYTLGTWSCAKNNTVGQMS